MTIRDTDRGAKALERRLAEIDGVKLSVGVHGDTGAKRHPSGGTVAEIASITELGSDKRAPVGYLRTTIDEQRDGLARRFADAGTRVLEGETIGSAFGPMAEQLAADVRARVPVDTGELRDSVEVRINGGRAA